MPTRDLQPAKILYIQNQYKKFEPVIKIAAWKYWEIVDILITSGVEREEAYAAAKWAADNRSEGKYLNISNVILVIN